MAQNGDKVVSLTHRPLFTRRKYSWYALLTALQPDVYSWSQTKDGRLPQCKTENSSVRINTNDSLFITDSKLFRKCLRRHVTGVDLCDVLHDDCDLNPKKCLSDCK